MLDHALASAKLTAGKDVEVINQRMPDAVTGFIAGAVPAVALWVPFDLEVRKRMPEARKLTEAGAYFPASAVLDGWAAGNEYHQENRDVLKRIIRGWIKANDYLVANRAEAIALLYKNRYSNLDRATLDSMVDALTAYPTAEWKRLYQDGSVLRWLQQTTDFFARVGNLKDVIPAERYFDSSVFLEVA
jgi:NitT/TauT family transport system substrate-binding protein